jgi:hypothetical protein
MALQRISKIVRTPENEVVYAIGDEENHTGYQMICSGCPGKEFTYNSAAAATTKNPRPAPREIPEDEL